MEQGQLSVIWEDAMLNYDAGNGLFDTLTKPEFIEVFDNHPENAARIKNIVSVLKNGPLCKQISFLPGRPASEQELETFHTKEYITKLQEIVNSGKSETLAFGTRITAEVWTAALLAAGCAVEAMRSILETQSKVCYALVRPPGHHAQPSQADGYCFLNNAGIATQFALKNGIKKIAIVDIDVHFGNGTFEGFRSRSDVLTVSFHMDHGSWGPSFPQSLKADELGDGKGKGFNLNIPLPNGTGDDGYELAMKELVVPQIDLFKPEVLVFVIGQDSSQFDPNGRMCLSMNGYRKLGNLMKEMAEKHSHGRILVVQEGGYHITYSAYCVHAIMEGLIGSEPLLEDPMAYYPEDLSPVVDRIKFIKETWKKCGLSI